MCKPWTTRKLDLRDGALVYTNAGHNPPLLIPRQGPPHYFPKTRQLVIGAVEDYPYQAETMRLTPGDRLLLYTDGVTEAMNVAGDLYGTTRLQEVLSALPDGADPAAVRAAAQRRGLLDARGDVALYGMRVTPVPLGG